MQPSSVEQTQEKITTFRNKLKLLFSNITMEPLVFTFVFPNQAMFIVTQNLDLKKACEVNLNYRTSVCEALTVRNNSAYNATEERTVQSLVASTNGYASGLQAFLTCITLLIVGSWSDTNRRRKPILMLPLLGNSMSALLLMLSLVFYHELPVQFNAFAEAFPQGVAGGWYVFEAAIFAYIGEDQKIERRTIRIGAISVFMLISTFTGLAMGGVLYRNLNLYQVYIIFITINLLGIVYTHFRIQEVPGNNYEVKSKSMKNLLVDVFKLNHAKRTLQMVLTKGTRETRIKVWLLIMSVWGSVGAFFGTQFICFIYLQHII